MEHNFWYWLIVNFLAFTIEMFLPLFPPHEHWGLAGGILLYGGELSVILLVFIGQFIDFTVLFFVASLAMLLWLWKHKGKLLKVIGFIRFLI